MNSKTPSGGICQWTLNYSSCVHPQSPLFVLLPGETDDQDSEFIITYYEAWQIKHYHQSWLFSSMRRFLLSIEKIYIQNVEERKKEIRNKGYHHPTKHDGEIVIAYFAGNSPDLLLNMLSCMEMTSISTSSSDLRVLPVMLNIRWSASDIAKALHIHASVNKQSNNGQQHYYPTMIIHDTENTNLSSKVEKAISLLKEDNNQYHHHISFALPLPRYSMMNDVHYEIQNKRTSQESTKHPNETHMLHNLDLQSDAIVIFTSGTGASGPKGVRLSHLSLLVQSMSKMQNPCNFDSNTRVLASTVPFFHIGGLSSTLSVMMSGGTLIFPSTSSSNGFSFDPNTTIKSFAKHVHSSSTSSSSITSRRRFTNRSHQSTYSSVEENDTTKANTLILVPTMLHSIINIMDKEAIHEGCGSRIRTLLIGGQSLTSKQRHKTRSLFPNASIIQTYACTEAASSITFADISSLMENTANPLTMVSDEVPSHGTYVGIAPPFVELKIFALKDQQSNPSTSMTKKASSKSSVGIIGTRGPHTMNGYWQRRNSLRLSDGSSNCKDAGLSTSRDVRGLGSSWLLTNDLGFLDRHGRLFFCGRANDVIRTGGETVNALEVEKTLIQHDNIDTCAVFSLPNEHYGEIVCAAVVLVDGSNMIGVSMSKKEESEGCYDLMAVMSTEFRNELRSFCKMKSLSGYKIPKKVYLMNDLPKNATGKVLKHELKRLCSDVERLRSKL